MRTETPKMTNAEFANSLRAVADFYEKHPDMPQPPEASLWVYTHSKTYFLNAAKMMADGGTIQKRVDLPGDVMNYYHVERLFGGFLLDLCITRETMCRKVKQMVEIETFVCPDSLLEEWAALPAPPSSHTEPDGE
jgi:hypothetical protein